ncbi:MAG: GlmU family protein [Bacteroidota bacterium]
MDVIFFDEPNIRLNLLPFTFTRPVAQIRVGILTIAEKWESLLGKKGSYSTQDYLQGKYPKETSFDNFFVNGAVCPDTPLLDAVRKLPINASLQKDGLLIACHCDSIAAPSFDHLDNAIVYDGEVTIIDEVWKIFKLNAAQIKADFALLTEGRKSAGITDPNTIVYGEEQIFVEEGASIKAAVLNAENGPIYIGKNAQVHEGALIKGSFALCEGAHVNMGAKIKGDSTVGPYSKVGGEVSNSVLFGYSNKGHDGFLGNSVIGEWCNLGADTNTSNLKNNYADVKLWHYGKSGFKNTGEMFCGLMMGDHSKCGINTMFNTGTVVGVGANIFGSGFSRNFIPSFAWGGANGFSTFNLNKFYETAEKVMTRRSKALDEVERKLYEQIFADSQPHRIWEKK